MKKAIRECQSLSRKGLSEDSVERIQKAYYRNGKIGLAPAVKRFLNANPDYSTYLWVRKEKSLKTVKPPRRFRPPSTVAQLVAHIEKNGPIHIQS